MDSRLLRILVVYGLVIAAGIGLAVAGAPNSGGTLIGAFVLGRLAEGWISG